MLKEAIICLFPEKLHFFAPAPTVPCWPLEDIPDLTNAGPIHNSHANTNILGSLPQYDIRVNGFLGQLRFSFSIWQNEYRKIGGKVVLFLHFISHLLKMKTY